MPLSSFSLLTRKEAEERKETGQEDGRRWQEGKSTDQNITAAPPPDIIQYTGSFYY
jgi:hypothetical protein